MPRGYPKYYKKKLAELREARGGKCEDCGSVLGLEFAHIRATKIKGRGRGQCARYHDIKKHPEAYRLICRVCHAKADDLPDNFHNYDYGDDDVPF